MHNVPMRKVTIFHPLNMKKAVLSSGAASQAADGSVQKKITLNLIGVNVHSVREKLTSGYFLDSTRPVLRAILSQLDSACAAESEMEVDMGTLSVEDDKPASAAAAVASSCPLSTHSVPPIRGGEDAFECAFEYLNRSAALCDWCRRAISSVAPDDRPLERIGIPVQYELQTSGVHRFLAIGTLCSMRCLVAAVKLEAHLPTQSRSIPRTSEHLLHLMAKLVLKGQPLPISAPDWRLLESNGGHLTSEEFNSFGLTKSTTKS
jgi:hypothetical protein